MNKVIVFDCGIDRNEKDCIVMDLVNAEHLDPSIKKIPSKFDEYGTSDYFERVVNKSR